MQKLSIFLAVALLATIGFYSCSNKLLNNNSLKGTSWKMETQVNAYSILNFKTNSECEGIRYWNGEVDATYTGTYTYIHPNISIDLSADEKYTGIVDNDTMTLQNEDGDMVIFYKQ